MSTPSVELTHIPEISRATFDNLMQLYLHDMSEFTGDQVEENGLFRVSDYVQRYWREAARHPFFIRAGAEIAGFALVRELAPQSWSIAEFFVIRRLRRSGIGKHAAFQLFDRFQGEWHVAEEEANLASQAFWRAVIAEYSGGEFEERHQEEGPRGPQQVFRSRAG